MRLNITLLILFIITIFFFSGSIVGAITIETKKGDIIKGNFGMEKVKVMLLLGVEVEISASEIIDISGEKLDTFELKDGTMLKGVIVNKEISIKTKYGDIKIPFEEIKSIDFETTGMDIQPSSFQKVSLNDVIVECWGKDISNGRIGGWKSRYPNCILDDGGGDSINAVFLNYTQIT